LAAAYYLKAERYDDKRSRVETNREAGITRREILRSLRYKNTQDSKESRYGYYVM